MFIFLEIVKNRTKPPFPDGDIPEYTIKKVSEILNIHPRTLMKYEKFRLLTPFRNPKNNRRMYSNNDLKWITCIVVLVHEKGFPIKNLNQILSKTPCWLLKDCSDAEKIGCKFFTGKSIPCWEMLKGICKHCVIKISCMDCVLFKKARERKNFVLESILTVPGLDLDTLNLNKPNPGKCVEEAK